MKDYGYIGIAFKENMQKADIIAIEVTKSNELKISDMYSTENSFPKTDISLGGKDNITDPKIDIAQMFLIILLLY